jgi:uncharacterized protein YjbI with pentapeptide repeats
MKQTIPRSTESISLPSKKELSGVRLRNGERTTRAPCRICPNPIWGTQIWAAGTWATPIWLTQIWAAVSWSIRICLTSICATPAWWKRTWPGQTSPTHSGATQNANFSEGLFDGASLVRANLAGANFSRADLSRADLTEANLAQADFFEAKFRSARLTRADLSGASLSDADFDGAFLDEARLTDSKLHNTSFTGSDLTRAVLTGADLAYAVLTQANLTESNCSGANLQGTLLYAANFSRANLRGAALLNAIAIRTDFTGADLAGCSVYGLSAWDVNLDQATQTKLVITQEEPHVHVDDLEVAQFIYLLLHRQKLRNVLTTLGERTVLILGRFTERKVLLEGIADKVRSLGYLPIVFDFDRPTDRDLTETVKVLAGLSLFVVADITNPRSVPLELQATVPDYMVPFVTLVERGQPVFGMFDDLPRKYDWALPLLEYNSAESLLAAFENKVVARALEKLEEVRRRKALPPPRRSAEDWNPQGALK